MSDSEAILERLEESLITPYDPDGVVWSAFLKAFAEEFAEIEEARAEIEDAKFVTTAEGRTLDRIAEIFDIERRRSESVEEFRARLKVALRSQLTSATVSEVEEISTVLLDADSEYIEVLEPESQDAFFQIAIDTQNVDVPIPPSILSDILNQVSAAGVDVGVNIFIGEGGTMILTGRPVTVSNIQSAGLSSENLGALSSDEWVL